MSETQRPKPATSMIEVPDLELEPIARPFGAVAGSPAAPMTDRAYSTPNLFDQDPFEPSGLSIELSQESGQGKVDYGSTLDFDSSGGFELEPSAGSGTGPASGVTCRARADEIAIWPSGCVPEAEALVIDPLAIGILADYGPAPSNALLAPLYAYRVFSRQRELKGRLAVLKRERERAESERETVLAELASEVRPQAELVPAFKRFFAPLSELEAIASRRGQALSAVHAELSAQSAALDTELTCIAERANAQQKLETAALSVLEERALAAQRAEATLKRVQIEIRAVTHVAEQKLGPQGGQIPEAEAAQLAALRRRAAAIEPDVTQTKSELGFAERALQQARTELNALRQSERQTLRRKQVLTEHYQKELRARSVGLSESETEQRKALADLGRAVLAARGTVPVADSWLERVRSTSERADKLVFQLETQRRALDAHDHARVTQGVRLACTALFLFILLIVLKVAL